MITTQKYFELRNYSDKGANLPPCDLEQMCKFEKYHNLRRKVAPGCFILPILTELQYMLIQHQGPLKDHR